MVRARCPRSVARHRVDAGFLEHVLAHRTLFRLVEVVPLCDVRALERVDDVIPEHLPGRVNAVLAGKRRVLRFESPHQVSRLGLAEARERIVLS